MIFKHTTPSTFDATLQAFYTLYKVPMGNLIKAQINEENWNEKSCKYLEFDYYRYAFIMAYLIKSEMGYNQYPIAYYYSKYDIANVTHKFACHGIDFDDVLKVFDIEFNLDDDGDAKQYYKTFGYSTDQTQVKNKTIDFNQAVKYLNWKKEADISYLNDCETSTLVNIEQLIEAKYPDIQDQVLNTLILHNKLPDLQGGDPATGDYFHLTLEQLLKLDKTLIILEGAPTESTPGQFGQFYLDDDYLYICLIPGNAGNAFWKRIPLLNYS